jgi:16S rRNA (guanine527-N7)-methyltransferase
MENLTETQKDLFAKLLTELQAWNKHTNLTGIREDKDIRLKHFADSFSVLQAIPATAKTLVDVGTGAGFPGLPIAIMRPDIHVTLIESVAKKTAYLEHVINVLNLSNVTVVLGRAEELAHTPEYREKFDVVTARAVAELRILAEYTLALLKVGGIFIAQKNAGQEEITHAENAIKTMGGSVLKQIPLNIAGLTERQLIVITKTKPTSAEYPRKSGLPAKKPL